MKVYVLILTVYGFSLSLTGLNKFMFGVLDLKIPLLATLANFSLVTLFLRRLYAFNGRRRPTISAAEYWKFLVPIALFTALDVGLSNLSYSLVSISAMTVIKSTNIVVTYAVSVAFGLEVFRWRVFSACLLVLGGVCVATAQGMEIKRFRGVIFLVGAVFSLSMRWVLVHRLTRDFEALDLVFLTLPISAIFILPVAFYVELWPLVAAADAGQLVTVRGSSVLALMLLCTSTLALALMYFEYLLVRRTSSLTLCVAGIGKEVVALLLSGLVFADHLSLRQWAAVSVSLLGIYLFSRVHRVHGKHAAAKTNVSTFRPSPTLTLSHLDILPFE